MNMVTLLRRAFIRDYQNIEDPDIRAAHGAMSSWLGIFLNAILVGLKTTSALLLAASGGWVFSLALLGDALNNLFDFSSCLISLIGFRITRKPADKEHPYGHGRAEYIAGMLIGVAIIVSAALLLVRSIQGIVEQEQVAYDLFAYIALGATLPLKGLQSYVNFSLGKTLRSPTLRAVGFDAVIDVLLSSTLLIGALISHFLQIGSLDSYLGAAVSLFLFVAGGRALKEASDPLLGAALPSELQHQVEEIALADPRVQGVHDFLCHSYGEGVRFLSFHVELDESYSLKQAHEIIDSIEEKVQKATHSSVVVHADPVRLHDGKLDAYKAKIEEVLSHYGEGLSFHDLHFKRQGGKQVLCFDVLLPFGFKGEAEIKRELGSLNVPFEVTFDHPYSD